MTDFSGKTIGQYELQEEITQSGVARVFRAWQPSVGREVAVKLLPQQFTNDRTFMQRFELEVQTIARLQHPHIVQILEYGEEAHTPYMAMTYYRGGTLAELIAASGSGLSLDRAIATVSQIASAIDYAHRKGIIHRNIKPSNILLDEDYNAYLTDFGVAKVAEASAQLTGAQVLGTPHYMAPELATPGGVSDSVDIYALGISFYEMLAASTPYNAPHQIGVLLAHVNKPVPDVRSLRPDIPESVQRVIAKVLAKKVSARYETASAFAEAIRQANEKGLPVSTTEFPKDELGIVPDDENEKAQNHRHIISTQAEDFSDYKLPDPVSPPPKPEPEISRTQPETETPMLDPEELIAQQQARVDAHQPKRDSPHPLVDPQPDPPPDRAKPQLRGRVDQQGKYFAPLTPLPDSLKQDALEAAIDDERLKPDPPPERQPRRQPYRAAERSSPPRREPGPSPAPPLQAGGVPAPRPVPPPRQPGPARQKQTDIFSRENLPWILIAIGILLGLIMVAAVAILYMTGALDRLFDGGGASLLVFNALVRAGL